MRQLIPVLLCAVLFVACISNNDPGKIPGKTSTNNQLDSTAGWTDVAGWANLSVCEQDAKQMIDEFRVKYRNDQLVDQVKDSLSRFVWFDKKVINALNAYLSDPNNKLDGVRIYFAAYTDRLPPPATGRYYPHQATLVLVPTIPGPTSKVHYDAWKVIPDPTCATGMKGAYNHGDICPNNCFTDSATNFGSSVDRGIGQ